MSRVKWSVKGVGGERGESGLYLVIRSAQNESSSIVMQAGLTSSNTNVGYTLIIGSSDVGIFACIQSISIVSVLLPSTTHCRFMSISLLCEWTVYPSSRVEARVHL